MLQRKSVKLTGRIQGVGFRPAVCNLAVELELTGIVYNDTEGVKIELQGPLAGINEFLKRLKADAKPHSAKIETCRITQIPLRVDEKKFNIAPSGTAGTPSSQVTPDMAVCRQCLEEMQNKNDFRYRYPFINCTNCGPRYSIVKNIPYDRPNTTMADFKMCKKCAAQYKDMRDRRFHAQPVACPSCGPHIYLTDNTGKIIETDSDKCISRAAQMLGEGKILAVKGIGGFHLAVNSADDKAVRRLRKRKKRERKPFALMTNSIEKIKQYAFLTPPAETALKSPERPIVLLPKKPHAKIADGIAEGVDTFGFMLCYAPLHFLLFEQGPDVLVMTSANLSDEPLICENPLALQQLADVADAFLMHNRDIHRQIDDSVVHTINHTAVPLRRARGYVPSPVAIRHNCKADILAAGADLKNTFCLVKQNQLICSEHIGDLADAKTFGHYVKSIKHLQKLFEVKPETIACDLHPGYLSSRYAESLPTNNLIKIQHHWAHIASVLAEYNRSDSVIGLECDGVGYGTDGTIWGCECLIASLENFERIGHLACYQLPGADRASREAIRPVMALIQQAFPDEFSLVHFGRLFDKIEPNKNKQQIISQQLRKNINTISSSSLGRVFDAVAAMLTLGSYNHYDAQLPMALEAIVDKNIHWHYDFELIQKKDAPFLLDLSITIKQILDDIRNDTEKSRISAKFHNCLAHALAGMACVAREKTGLNSVVLGGGVFCNRYLTSRLIHFLKQKGFDVLYNRIFPANDGGIAVGQAAIAAHRAKSVKQTTHS